MKGHMANIFFKAGKLMREAVLLSSLLTNSETWINITKKDLEDLKTRYIFAKKNIINLRKF